VRKTMVVSPRVKIDEAKRRRVSSHESEPISRGAGASHSRYGRSAANAWEWAPGVGGRARGGPAAGPRRAGGARSLSHLFRIFEPIAEPSPAEPRRVGQVDARCVSFGGARHADDERGELLGAAEPRGGRVERAHLAKEAVDDDGRVGA